MKREKESGLGTRHKRPGSKSSESGSENTHSFGSNNKTKNRFRKKEEEKMADFWKQATKGEVREEKEGKSTGEK